MTRLADVVVYCYYMLLFVVSDKAGFISQPCVCFALPIAQFSQCSTIVEFGAVEKIQEIIKWENVACRIQNRRSMFCKVTCNGSDLSGIMFDTTFRNGKPTHYCTVIHLKVIIMLI